MVVLEHLILHTNFQSHRPFSSREEDFFMFLPYMGILVIWTNFCSPVPLRLHMKFGFHWHCGFSGKEVWKCWIWVALDQWMTLTFDIHIGPCTHLVNCIYQLWHPLFYPFSIQKHMIPNLTLPKNGSRSTQDHHLNKFSSTRAPTAAYQVSRPSASYFRRRRFFKVFTIYGHGCNLGHVTWTIWTNFRSPILRRLYMKFGFNRPSGFKAEDVWKCWHTHNTHIQTTEAYLSCNLTTEPLAQVS